MTSALLTHRRPATSRDHLLRLSHTVNGAQLDGIDGKIVEVQARAVELLDNPRAWTRAVQVAGMPSDEAGNLLTRIACAIGKLGHPVSHVRIVLNFHPHGTGESLVLPAAIAIMQAAGILPPEELGDYLVFGALDLHGEVRHVDGALPLALAARAGQRIVCPHVDAKQCLLAKAVKTCTIHPVADLETAMRIATGKRLPIQAGGRVTVEPVQKAPVDFASIKGQQRAKRAAEIAAAGGHCLLLVGSPGCGKTLLANAIAGILPPLSNAEKVELTRIWSAAGLITEGQAVTRRPFRTVHNGVTVQSLIGGGRIVQPGEVTLAHLGVLFLDEIPQFKASTLDALRAPMEDGTVKVSRVASKVTLPSRFSLVAAMNPCPCGYYPKCKCGEAKAAKYQSKISGPLLDRIDLSVAVEPVPLDAPLDGESSAVVRGRVSRAMDMQRQRLTGTPWHSNADVPGTKAAAMFRATPEATQKLTELAQAKEMSMRRHDRLLKVARTIADLAGSEEIHPQHITEAADYV